MARYSEDFVGMRGGFRSPTGSDPNYQDGYRGMRFGGPPGRARYGSHRRMHRDDLGGYEGQGGIHRGQPTRGYAVEYDRQGHLGKPSRSRGLIREFNAESPALRRGNGGDRQEYGRDFGPRFRPDEQRGRYRPSYSNRGLRPAGFSENWGPYRPGGGR